MERNLFILLSLLLIPFYSCTPELEMVDLVGIWESPSGFTLVLREDSTCNYRYSGMPGCAERCEGRWRLHETDNMYDEWYYLQIYDREGYDVLDPKAEREEPFYVESYDSTGYHYSMLLPIFVGFPRFRIPWCLIFDVDMDYPRMEVFSKVEKKYEETDKKRLYQLMDLYLAGHVRTLQFCDAIVGLHKMGMERFCLTEEESTCLTEIHGASVLFLKAMESSQNAASELSRKSRDVRITVETARTHLTWPWDAENCHWPWEERRPIWP